MDGVGRNQVRIDAGRAWTVQLIRVSLGVALFSGLLVGCTDTAAPEGPYEAEYREAQNEATTSFERSALDDGRVTRGEYEEAHDRYTRCMDDAGFPVELIDQAGYYVYSMTQAPGVDEADDRCAEGTIAVLTSLYVGELTNPENEDYPELIVRCLIREGAVEPGYSREQFLSETNESSMSYDAADPRVDSCMANPSQGHLVE